MEDRKLKIIEAGTLEFAHFDFSDSSTDRIIERAGVSKGLLFHYFGSKKGLYLECLKRALDELCVPPTIIKGTFEEVLFSVLDQKLELCRNRQQAMLLVNMSSRESSRLICSEIKDVVGPYTKAVNLDSSLVLGQAMKSIKVRSEIATKAYEALLLYTSALIRKYLGEYQKHPEDFFSNSEKIKEELREALGFMLYGIVEAK